MINRLILFLGGALSAAAFAIAVLIYFERSPTDGPQDASRAEVRGGTTEWIAAVKEFFGLQSLEGMKRTAEAGDAEAQFDLGVRYANGRGVKTDYAEAARWLRLAAEQGHADAQYYFGTLYYNGQGVDANHREALQWYRKAAEQGHVHAQFNVGYMYSQGQGVRRDYREAQHWFERAAERGDKKAKEALRLLAEIQSSNVQAASRWKFAPGAGRNSLKRSVAGETGPTQSSPLIGEIFETAERGDVDAQRALGDAYRLGIGVHQDHAEAARWYRKAADQGHPSAQSNLGVMY